MPQRNGHVPSYRLHKASGQARVNVNGKRVYRGAYGTPESRENYARVIAEMSAGQETAPRLTPSSNVKDLSISELILAYWQFAKSYYSKDGQPTKELECMREALRPLRHLFGHTRAVDFGARALKTVRQHMVDEQDLCRNVVNRRIGRIKRVFKWAVAEELIEPSAYHALQAVTGLRFGRTNARETQPVKPVDDEHVELVLPFLTPHVAAMVRVQRLTGMRPGDLVKMRPIDIDRTDDVWMYEPFDHKNRWREHRRLIAAQTFVEPLQRRREYAAHKPGGWLPEIIPLTAGQGR